MGGGASVHKVPAETLLSGVTCDPRVGSVTADEAIDTIAAAFCGTESTPNDSHYLDWTLGPRFKAFDSPERISLCKYNGKYANIACTKKGTVLGLRDPETKEVLGVLLLRRTPETNSDMVSAMMKAGSPPHMKSKVFGKEPMKRDEALVKEMKKLAYTGGAQYIIYMLAVKPAHQGKGNASALVRAVFALGDLNQVPVTLDCGAGGRQEAMYAKLGFEKHTEIQVADPTNQEGSGPFPMVSMVRKPVPPAAPA